MIRSIRFWLIRMLALGDSVVLRVEFGKGIPATTGSGALISDCIFWGDGEASAEEVKALLEYGRYHESTQPVQAEVG